MRHEPEEYREYMKLIEEQLHYKYELQVAIERVECLQSIVANQTKLPMPRCCANCCSYSDEGFCSEFDEEVPQDWAKKVNWCDSWCDEIPF